MAVLTFLYLIYLAAPISLLLLGSFGDQWANSLLPTGASPPRNVMPTTRV